MNFNIYIDDETGSKLNRAVERTGQTRNALIRQALTHWLGGQFAPQWPPELLEFVGFPEIPAFESTRQELSSPANDPLA
jgi:hypothetical protein